MLKKFVRAFISSKLDYCNALLYGMKVSSLNKLQRVQNYAARLVCELPARLSVTDEVLVELHWLSVEKRIAYKILLTVHKFFIGIAPNYLYKHLIVRNVSERFC